jgi:hypothetical protein
MAHTDCTTTRSGSTFVSHASRSVKAAIPDILDAHTSRDKAKCFRDIGKYTFFEIVEKSDTVNVVHVGFPAKIAWFSFPQMFCKRTTLRSAKHGRIEFWTPPKSIADINGAWDLDALPNGHTLVNFHQSVTVPGWAKFLPIESYVASRVTRMMQDLDTLH